MEQVTEGNPARSHSHPIVYLFLVLPFGIQSGFITVTYAYLFAKAGATVEQVAALVGASLLPNVLKFLWAPLVDTTLTLKKWYVLSAIATAAGIIAMGILPIKQSSLPMLTFIVVASNIAASFLGMATNGLAAYDTPEELKGRVSGYCQAGNLGGSGLGGGAGLLLAQHLNSSAISSAIIAVSCVLCCIGLFYVKEPLSTIKTEKIFDTLKNLFSDIWQTLKAKIGWLAILLCFLPLGTGAASNLWSAVSGNWGASADTVAFVTGIASGLITAVGCLIGGWICDRIDRQMAYVIFGFTEVLCAVGMAYSPHSEAMYIVWTSLYAASLGLCYAGFNAFVLEAIGKGAAGTKFTVYASLSNAPIYYMTILDGWACTKYGATGMLDVEAAFGIIGILLFYGVLKIVGSPKELNPAN